MTKPIEAILPRSIEPKLQELLNYFSEGLDEIVNFGTHILKWDSERKVTGDYNLPATLFLRNFVEKVDAISVLTRQSQIDSAKTLLRTAIENFFYLEYILQKDTFKRSMSFLVCDTIGQISSLSRYNSKTAQGKQFLSKIRKDKLLSNFELPEKIDIEEFKKNKNVLLNSEGYKETKKEYYNFKNKYKKTPNWYSLYNGPRKIEDLAESIGYSGMYETFYRLYSKSTHSNDILEGKIKQSKTGFPQIFQIRFPGDAQFIVYEIFSITLILYSTFIEKRLKEKTKEFQKWTKDVQIIFQKIGKMSINIE